MKCVHTALIMVRVIVNSAGLLANYDWQVTAAHDSVFCKELFEHYGHVQHTILSIS